MLWDGIIWDTNDVISCHGHDIIKGTRQHLSWFILVLPIWLFTLDTCACLDWHADVPTFLEPTSFKCNWLSCCYYCKHPWHINAPDTSETSREHCSIFFEIYLHRTALPLVGAHVHYLCCRRSTSPEAYCCWVGILPPCIAYITILGVPGWVPTEHEWPKSWTLFHLGCDPSLQVWLLETGRTSHMLSYLKS